MLQVPPRHRVKSKWSARSRALYLRADTPMAECVVEPLCLNPSAPWCSSIPVVSTEVPGIGKKAEMDSEELREKVLTCIRGYAADYVAYSDGSAAGSINGWCGVVITTGDPEGCTIISTKAAPGGPLCSSFSTEYTALGAAVDL